MAITYGITDSERLFIKKQSHKGSPLYRGMKGELNVHKKLLELDNNFHVFCGTRIVLTNKKSQIDFVVVSKRGIISIEVKNWSEEFLLKEQAYRKKYGGKSPHFQADMSGRVPEAVSNQVRVRVRMDNTGTDYYDISNGNFTVNPPIWIDLGFSLPGTYGAPLFVGESTLMGGATISLTLSNALENTTANLVVGFAELNFSPFFGGTLVPDIGPPGFFVPLPTDGAGNFQIVETWPTGVPSGFTLYLQYWIDDAAGPFGFSASNAISGTVP